MVMAGSLHLDLELFSGIFAKMAKKPVPNWRNSKTTQSTATPMSAEAESEYRLLAPDAEYWRRPGASRSDKERPALAFSRLEWAKNR
jgi:hypothetical protein